MTALPPRLAEIVADLEPLDRMQRAEMLIEYADQFVPASDAIATRPYPEARRAPGCESEAFVFATDRPDGTLDYAFAVENPQGISAKSWAAILAETCSGVPLADVSAIPQDVIFSIYGRELSMGKGQGLIGMLTLVQAEARRRLAGAGRG